MAHTEAHLLDQLVTALEDGERVFRGGSAERREETLIEVLGVVGSLYPTLSSVSPEVATHLDAIFDASIRALGDAFAGDFEPLVAVITRVYAILAFVAPRGPRNWLLLAA